MTHVIRGDYGPIDLQAIAQWNRGVERARHDYHAHPFAYCPTPGCANLTSCARHRGNSGNEARLRSANNRAKRRAAYQGTDGERAAARKRMRAYRAKKKRSANG